MRRILAIDMDSYYASVEIRDDPSLRGKPVAVGTPNGRGVVLTASYEARKYGVHSALPSRMALERCPGLVFVPPRMGLYREIAGHIRGIFGRYSDLVEPVSIDEAYLDVTEPKRGPPSGTRVAQLIKRDIWRETGLTASAGVSYCKMLAKIASGQKKPDGLTVIRPEQGAAFSASLPIERFPGIGPKTAAKLREMGVRSGLDLRRYSEEELRERFGKSGLHYYRICRGIDERPVDPHRERKSVSSETTFEQDLRGKSELLRVLPGICEDTARRLERVGESGRGVVVKIKYADYSVITRRTTLPLPVCTAESIHMAAREILEGRVPLEQPVRLLGVGVTDLMPEGGMVQGSLFPELLGK